jgi:arsenite methyltransferase
MAQSSVIPAETGTPPIHVSLDLDSPELAATYDEVSTRQFNHGKVLVEALAPRTGERVLDIGCGTGRLGAYVADRVAPTGEVIGIDPLPLRVSIAARKHPYFRALVGRAEDLSAFADQSFEVAYSNSVFHWIADKPRALSEAYRVLSAGGRIGINSADGERPHQSVALVRDALLEAGLRTAASAKQSGHNYRVSAQQLAHLLREAGFVEVVVSAHTFVDDVSGADDLIRWSSSSSFGNFLTELDAGERRQVRDRLEAKLQSLTTAEGIRLERHLVFATARRP